MRRRRRDRALAAASLRPARRPWARRYSRRLLKRPSRTPARKERARGGTRSAAERAKRCGLAGRKRREVQVQAGVEDQRLARQLLGREQERDRLGRLLRRHRLPERRHRREAVALLLVCVAEPVAPPPRL